MAVRLIFFLLVLANLIFFALGQGYFGAEDPNREPDRVNQQLQPEKLRVTSIASTPDASAPPPPAPPANELACRVVGGLVMVDAEALKAAALAVGAEAQLMPQVDPVLYLVVIGDLANAAAAEKKAAELKRFGVSAQETVALDGGRQEIVLGRLPNEAAAKDFLLGLNKLGIKSARVEARDQPPAKARVELRGAATRLLQQLPRLIAPYADASVTECPK